MWSEILALCWSEAFRPHNAPWCRMWRNSKQTTNCLKQKRKNQGSCDPVKVQISAGLKWFGGTLRDLRINEWPPVGHNSCIMMWETYKVLQGRIISTYCWGSASTSYWIMGCTWFFPGPHGVLLKVSASHHFCKMGSISLSAPLWVTVPVSHTLTSFSKCYNEYRPAWKQ